MSDPFYITTAISYPNGPPHIGHAYELIGTDAIARFMRLDGRDVFFLTGTDEHGQKMVQTAARSGISPRDLADANAAVFQAMATALDASNDDFIRTTEPRHYAASQAIWQRMADAGHLYLDRYSGWYSVRDEAFYAAEETSVREDGVRVGPQGTPVEWQEEESWFFRLSAFQDKLLAYYAEHPRFILPDSRRNEIVSFVKGGLQDLSISRTAFDWGVPVPGSPGHVMYVWVDALTNYVTATGVLNGDGKGLRSKFWPANVHIIGKDIVRFHAVYWPAFLMAAGLPVPKTVFGHGFLTVRGEKMSKSEGNIVDPFGLAKTYGTDAVRFFFLREIAWGGDGSYSQEAIVTRTNADLANDLGNLAQRSLSMIAKNLGGVLPAPGAFSPADSAMLDMAGALLPKARAAMADFALHTMLADIWAVVAEANRYFAGAEPWALRKSDPERFGTVLWTTAEVIRRVAILAQPVITVGAPKLLDLLAVPADKRRFADLETVLTGGTQLPTPVGVFPRIMPPEEAS
jgi:methionyl-tRNA synthetase